MNRILHLLAISLTLFYTHFNMAPNAIPSGNDVGKSFNECTTKSTRPLSRASSNSSVNKDFSPILGKDLSKILSPLVTIVTVNKMYSLSFESSLKNSIETNYLQISTYTKSHIGISYISLYIMFTMIYILYKSFNLNVYVCMSVYVRSDYLLTMTI